MDVLVDAADDHLQCEYIY
jgi:hypothetical protein